MEIRLAFGREKLVVPPRLSAYPVLAAPGLEAAKRPEELLAQAASQAAEKLAALSAPCEPLALIVPDRTRPLPLPDILPPVLSALARKGFAASGITLIPASGMHRPMDLREFKEWIGPEAAESGVRLSPHDCDAPGIELGSTGSGIPVVVHPQAANAGALLILGRIVFHYLAGFGGGRKMISPGISARETILAIHRRCLSSEPGAGRHKGARTGRLEGNPVNEGACEAARFFPRAVCIHFHITEQGKLSRAAVGDPVADHARECEVYAASYRTLVPEPLDAVIVSAGGAPLDGDLVQAHKALDAVAPVVRDGGTVILVARCDRGVGNPELLEGFRLGSPQAVEAELRRDFRVGLHTAMAFLEKTRRLSVYALTELPDEILTLCGMGRVRSLEEAEKILRDRHGENARIALAPSGASLLYEIGKS
jgi:nickel-dependent lactate racemase